MTREAYGVFEGGGVKGIALVGALKAAEELGFTFRAVAGTSAGAIVASLVAAGYTADELRSILMEKDFKEFKDPVSGWIPGANIAQVWNKMGFYKGDHFHTWIREKLASKFFDSKKKSLTFKKLFEKTGIPLTVVAIELISQEVRAFESSRNETIHVADAVRMSMSIPFFFVPYRLGTELYVDGGVLSNFPAWVFKNTQLTDPLPILGFCFERPDANDVITDLKEFSLALVGTVQKVSEQLLNENTSGITQINLPTCGISTTDFDLTEKQKENLYRAGYENARKQLELFLQNPTPEELTKSKDS